MNISTKGRYALSYLTDLAMQETNAPLSVKESAEHCGISEKYLEQIVGTLQKNQIIRSVRGSHGGYYLATKPDECTVGKVLRVMEGSLNIAPCLIDEGRMCERRENCSNLVLWKKMDEALSSVIDHVTIADMCIWKKGEVVHV